MRIDRFLVGGKYFLSSKEIFSEKFKVSMFLVDHFSVTKTINATNKLKNTRKDFGSKSQNF